MASKEEKRRRAALVQAIVDKDTQKAIAEMPISLQDLDSLFNYLDEHLETEGCDHTNNITCRFLASKHLNQEKILPWLETYGGYCDCEVLANVEDSWESEINKMS
ncbi:MAG: DUF2695 domain-containing protein [Methylophilaceae bacterium]